MVKWCLFSTLLLSACGQKSALVGKPDQQTTPFQDQSYLTLVGFTGSIVKREKRFSGYSKSAGRISLIDPSTETEFWERQINGTYDLTAPLPDYSGIALLSGQSLSIVLQDSSEKTFQPIEFPIGYVARSSDSATYAFVSKDGQAFRVIHQLGNGNWQEETLDSPFVVPPNFSTPPGSEPPLSIVQISGNGNQLLFFKPSDGSYAYYTSDLAGGPIAATPKRKCPGDPSVAVDAPALFRSLALDDNSSLAVQGDRFGVVSVFDPAAACVAPADRPAQTLGDPLAIIDITVAKQGKVAVTQVGGRLHTLNVAVDSLEKSRTIEGVCNYPLGALPVGPDGMALVCVDAQDVSTDAGSISPASVDYQAVSVQLVSLVSGLPIFQRGLDVEDTAAAALDPDVSRVLILKDSSIGILNVLDLTTGEQHSKKGLFLGGILD